MKEKQAQSEYDLAADLFRKGQPRLALQHALRSVELDEQNPAASYLAAWVYLELCRGPVKEDCRLSEAERHARHAVEVKRDYREARNLLGTIFIHQKRYPEAVTLLKELTQDMLYQTPALAWGNLGWAYLESGQLDAAIDALSHSIAAEPLYCVGKYRLGLAYERKKQPNAALDALTAALETDHPDCQRLQHARLARARVLSGLGRKDEAMTELERCVALASATPEGKECRIMAQKSE